MEQGKPVLLLSRKGHRKVIDGSAGNRGRRKRRPLCSGADTGCVSKIDNIAGLRKQADFLLVFHTRKLDSPAYEAKQMTTVKTVGAASRKPHSGMCVGSK